MAGYWPNSFYACLIRDEVEVHKLAKKERGQYPAILTEQDLLYGVLEEFCMRDTAGGPDRARWVHLARSGSQSQHAIWLRDALSYADWCFLTCTKLELILFSFHCRVIR